MRHFIDNSAAGRAEMHALVIGVGIYPHLVDGSGRRFNRAGTLKQLTSPPISARTFAEWLQVSYRGPSVVLGSLELLISDPRDRTDAPTMENIRNAVKSWKRRADSRDDNIALFYFCGHGLSAGVHDGVLPSDFGEDDDAVLQKCIDIGGLQLGMDNCRARRQVFFIDACRSTPSWLTELVIEGGIGDPILDARIRQGRYGPRDAPRFFATSPNQQAYGRRDDVSLFTEALLESFSGAAGIKTRGNWVVRTDSILIGLNQMLQAISDRDLLPFQPAVLDRASGYVFHLLPGPADVHVSLTCTPPSANALADMAVRTEGAVWFQRPGRESAPWELKRPAGAYEFRATFSNREYEDKNGRDVVWPPGPCPIALEVTR